MVTRMNIGGPSLHVAVLSNQLDPERYSTCLVVGRTEQGEGSRLPWVDAGPARVVRINALCRPIRPSGDLRAFFQILRVIWREQPQVIHTHMAKAGWLGRSAGWIYNRFGPGRPPGKKAIVIHTFHGHVLEGYFPPIVSWVFASLERWMAKRTDCLIAVSETIRDSLLARGIGREQQWRVVRLGVDLSRLTDLPGPCGLLPLRCGLVGRLVPIKNPSLFLEAIGQAARQQAQMPIHGCLIGDGPLRPELEETARRLGLEKAVSFLGWQEEARACYGNLDVVCITSWNEGTPLSLIEAMAAGRTAVATTVGGVRDLLGSNGKIQIPPGGFEVAARGLLVRAGDARGLASALTVLANNPPLRRRLAEAGRLYVGKEYSHMRLLREMDELYQQLTADSERSS
jgi:glycosyltransferase involved in cell wall biosynthesis